MTVLVTGGAGFIGSHTVKALVRAGRSVVVIDDLSAGHASSVPSDVPLIVRDFSDPRALDEAMDAAQIEACIHFAAKKDAAESVHEPLLYYMENTTKSVSLLNQLRARGIDRFVFSSTAAVYGDPITLPIDEAHPTFPTNPYGWSKLFFERVLSDVGSVSPFRSVSLRYFNAAGADVDGELGNAARDRQDLVSVLMESAVLGRVFTINGSDYETSDGTPVRDLVHVTDLADAHVLALDYLDRGGATAIVNLGSEHGFTVREIADEMVRLTGVDLSVVAGPRRPGDIVTSVASSVRAHKLLGWSPSHSDLETIVNTSWAWEQARSGRIASS